jgi:hypothetical protein
MPTICNSESGTDIHWLSTRVYTHSLTWFSKIKRIDWYITMVLKNIFKSQRTGQKLSVLGQCFHENHKGFERTGTNDSLKI